jgi:hypothetical protein
MQKNALFFVGACLCDTCSVDAGYSNTAGINYRLREKSTNASGCIFTAGHSPRNACCASLPNDPGTTAITQFIGMKPRGFATSIW